ncbi:hypothetical protein [Parvibaculum sp.]|uniref:hypothetical protein n=1 Tax=Parvibaculum sp. TaxID=2024848 RepID=UPI00262EC386|nr:hypothetical protein [Parvibaculum sp.]MCW5727209.1 hypothetical protein [Parvibaculum sp.]
MTDTTILCVGGPLHGRLVTYDGGDYFRAELRPEVEVSVQKAPSPLDREVITYCRRWLGVDRNRFDVLVPEGQTAEETLKLYKDL